MGKTARILVEKSFLSGSDMIDYFSPELSSTLETDGCQIDTSIVKVVLANVTLKSIPA